MADFQQELEAQRERQRKAREAEDALLAYNVEDQLNPDLAEPSTEGGDAKAARKRRKDSRSETSDSSISSSSSSSESYSDSDDSSRKKKKKKRAKKRKTKRASTGPSNLSDFRIPKKRDFHSAVDSAPSPPKISGPKKRQRVRLDGELSAWADSLFSGQFRLTEDREEVFNKLPLVASFRAVAPRTDFELVTKASQSTPLYVNEAQLLPIHESVMNALNCVVFAVSALKESAGFEAIDDRNERSDVASRYMEQAAQILAWTNQDLLGCRRERLIRALRLSPDVVPGLKIRPVEDAINENPRIAEDAPDIFGPEFMKIISPLVIAKQKESRRSGPPQSARRSSSRFSRDDNKAKKPYVSNVHSKKSTQGSHDKRSEYKNKFRNKSGR